MDTDELDRDDFHYDEVAIEDDGGDGDSTLLDLDNEDDRALDALVRSVQATKDRDAPPPVPVLFLAGTADPEALAKEVSRLLPPGMPGDVLLPLRRGQDLFTERQHAQGRDQHILLLNNIVS